MRTLYKRLDFRFQNSFLGRFLSSPCPFRRPYEFGDGLVDVLVFLLAFLFGFISFVFILGVRL